MAPAGVATLPLMSVGVVQQVLSFLSGLAGTGSNLSIPVVQDIGVYPIISTSLKMDKASRIDGFPHSILGNVMIGAEYDLLTKFLKMKHQIF